MQNQKNIIILLAILLAISVNFNINYKKELQRIEELDQEMAWGHYDLYTFSLRQLTLDVQNYLEAKDQESLIQLVVQRNRVYDNYYQLVYKNGSASFFEDFSYAMKDFNWRILDFTRVIRHMDLQDIEDNKELILAINQHFSDSFYDFYEFTRNRATTMSVSVGSELIRSQPIRASVLDLFENQRELAKKVNQATDRITPMLEELKVRTI